jgi:F-type H+-transporting ATPase subunit delta
MASKVVVAKRYAKALAAQAKTADLAKTYLQGLQDLAAVFASSTQLSQTFASPRFNASEKWAVLSELVKKLNFSKDLGTFLQVLLEADRMVVLPELCEQLKAIVMHLEGATEAVVETADQLTDAQSHDVQKSVEKMTGKKVYMNVVLNRDLIAGLRITVDGKTLDASLVASLGLINRRLLAAQA